jgi:mono/diheme cytochrome c family protein
VKRAPAVPTARAAVALAALASLGGAGCSGGPPPGDGRGGFAMLCASCHGPDGRPPEAMVARLAVRDLTAPEFRARVSEALVEHQIRAGSKNKLMPSFAGAIDDAQIKAIARFVASPEFLARPPPAAPR